MPIGKLIFKLPEEEREFELAQKALALSCFISDFSNYLSRKYKHSEPPSKGAYAEYEEIRNEFYRMMNDEHDVGGLVD